MNAEILAVGTELLLGDTLNTNAQFIAKELAKLGISTYFQTVVGDNRERLLSALEIAYSRAQLVITTGGLGPTGDDLTKEVCSEYFKKELVLNDEILQGIVNYFKSQGFEMTENNKKQAYIPKDATIIKNNKGTAPGIIVEQNDKVLILLPGPPVEMTPMFENMVVPFLRTKTNVTFYSKRVKICGVGESKVESIVKDLIDNQTNPTIAPYAKASEVTLRVTASAENEAKASEIMQPTIDEISKRLGDNIYTIGDDTLEQAVVKLIAEKKMTIACAESCTGGLLTGRFVNVSGISSVLLESVVTYSDNSKISRLNVKPETLSQYGAVSEQVAAEMAQGIASTANSNIGVSITGIAGPDGGTDEKPVGLVYIAVCINGKTSVKQFKFSGDRQRIRTRTVVNALDLIRRELLNV